MSKNKKSALAAATVQSTNTNIHTDNTTAAQSLQPLTNDDRDFLTIIRASSDFREAGQRRERSRHFPRLTSTSTRRDVHKAAVRLYKHTRQQFTHQISIESLRAVRGVVVGVLEIYAQAYVDGLNTPMPCAELQERAGA